MNIKELKLEYRHLVRNGRIAQATKLYNQIYELVKESKKMIVRFTEQDAYYPIQLLLPRTDLTIEEAKELVDKLQAQIEISEWNQAEGHGPKETAIINHWSQDYLESFNDDGFSID